jgi:Domain of unknown function (DUF4232)
VTLAPPPTTPPLPDELEALIREARERQRRRWLIGGASVAVAVAVGLLISALVGGSTLLGSLRGPLGLGGVPSCKPAGLVAQFSLQGGGFFGTDAGGLILKNRGSSSCSVPAWPQVSLQWNGQDLAPETRLVGYQPDPAQRVTGTLRPGRWAFAPLLWSDWCKKTPFGRGVPPTILSLRLPTGTKQVQMHPSGHAVWPGCSAPGHPSIFGVGQFYSPLPTGWIP